MQNNRYDMLSCSELLDRIRYRQDDGAAYYLVFNKARPALYSIMIDNGILNDDDQYDTLMDFYLYLRDGAKKNDPVPYAAFLLIREPDKLVGWIKQTLKFHLLEKAKIIDKKLEAEKGFHNQLDNKERIFTADDLEIVIYILEMVNRDFSAPERYLFFSDMYAMQTGKKDIAAELMETLQCTPGNLRVMRHRIKAKVKILLQKSLIRR